MKTKWLTKQDRGFYFKSLEIARFCQESNNKPIALWWMIKALFYLKKNNLQFDYTYSFPIFVFIREYLPKEFKQFFADLYQEQKGHKNIGYYKKLAEFNRRYDKDIARSNTS